MVSIINEFNIGQVTDKKSYWNKFSTGYWNNPETSSGWRCSAHGFV